MGSQDFAFCIFHAPNWGVHASLRGNDLPSSFSKTVILHLDTLLESFNYHYFACHYRHCCDPLFRFSLSAFYLPSGGRSWDFLCNLGSVISEAHRLLSEISRSLGWFGGSAGLCSWELTGYHGTLWCSLPTNTLGSSLLWDFQFLCLLHSFPRVLSNQFLQTMPLEACPHPNLN